MTYVIHLVSNTAIAFIYHIMLLSDAVTTLIYGIVPFCYAISYCFVHYCKSNDCFQLWISLCFVDWFEL